MQDIDCPVMDYKYIISKDYDWMWSQHQDTSNTHLHWLDI